MAFSKTGLFEEQLQETARLFKSLAHPARLQILKYLAETKVCITGDISEHIPLSRTTVNQHLAELRKAGLISGTIKGVKTNYCLNPDAINDLIKKLDDFITCFESYQITKC